MSKRKKYSPRLAKERAMQGLLKDYVMCAIGSEPIRVLDLSTGGFVATTPSLVEAFYRCNYKWSYVAAVHGYIKSAKEKFIKVHQESKGELKSIINIANEFELIHDKLKQGAGINIVNTGWIASPYGYDIADMNNGDFVMDLFEQMGAWENN